MARQQAESPPTAVSDPWAKLTWDDLQAWSGARSLERGRSYQRSHHVRDLARTADGRLLAWVQGTERYATTVELLPKSETERLRSRCSCPVGFNGCKHAVAVVLEYLEALRNETPVPTASDADKRWKKLPQPGTADAWEEDEEEYDEDEDENEPRSVRPAAPARKTALRDMLAAKSVDELVEMILDHAQRYPEIHKELAEQQALQSGDRNQLVRQAKKEIDELTSQPAWRHHWDDEGEVPDYSGLQRRFEHLLAHGEADALLELGRRLLDRGTQQVGQSDDEGETASAISDCMNVVFQAVPQSNLSDAEKVQYVIDACLDDEYELCNGVDVVLDRTWPKAAWSGVADNLARRVKSLPASTGDEFSRNYRRDRLTDWLISALDRAGRSAEATTACEKEAPITSSYERLVRRLMEEGRLEDADRWAGEGIEKTQERWPGIANHLRELQRQMAEKRGDWPCVAAHHAEAFFEHPSVPGLEQLLKAAGKAGCKDVVRAAVQRFLETGVRPVATGAAPSPLVVRQRAARGKKAPAAGTAWPLPAVASSSSDPAARRRAPDAKPEPYYDVLIDLAIQEKRPDDVLKWYDQMRGGRRAARWHFGGESAKDARVADAVAGAHPERALALYRQLADNLIAQTSPSAYEAAAVHLRKERDLLRKHKRAAEWDRRQADLRAQNRRKRRFLEILERLDGRPIIEG